MGEVYKARDTRLDRTVAIKVLATKQLDSVEARDRFGREARAVSGLNHPNICTLYDIGHQDGLDYLVMEYLEGETLQDRLARGPLPLDQTLIYAVQIAAALDRAHRQGVVHRDLKPGNIMLTKAGAKLLDFGLATMHDSAAATATSALTSMPTQALTTPGMIMGTIQYMVPEQLEGKQADARSDLFAFGAVLYEMVTGRKAFEGKTQASVIAAILERESPAPSSLQPASPPALDRVIAACLAKDPDERWQSAHDLMLELRWIAEGSPTASAASAPEKPKTAHRGGWIAATLLLATTLALAAAYYRRAPAQTRVLKFSIAPPDQATIELVSPVFTSLPALSPDGRHLVFAARRDGKIQLWIRDLDSVLSRPLDGTQAGSNPFWSPDSRFVAFFAGGKLMKVDISGGSPLTLCDSLLGRGGSWNQNDVIIFAPALATGLARARRRAAPPKRSRRSISSAARTRTVSPGSCPMAAISCIPSGTPIPTSPKSSSATFSLRRAGS